MRVLVTGSAGFLGRHIARHFSDIGWDVTGFDIVASAEPGVAHVQADLTDADSVQRALRDVDVVAHVGAIGDVYLAGQQPSLAAEVNVVGTANVIEAAQRHGVRLVYASTWEVYGEPVFQPITEDHPTMPDHPYNITKLAGESLVLAAEALKDVSAVALRLGTAYGSGLRPNSVFRIFIDKARKGEPITIQGDGSQGRQFTYAGDIARSFEIAATSRIRGEAFNIVAPEMTSIRKLAEAIVARYPTDISFGDPRPGEIPPAHVSAEKARNMLGWKARTPFDQGLQELIESEGINQ